MEDPAIFASLRRGVRRLTGLLLAAASVFSGLTWTDAAVAQRTEQVSDLYTLSVKDAPYCVVVEGVTRNLDAWHGINLSAVYSNCANATGRVRHFFKEMTTGGTTFRLKLAGTLLCMAPSAVPAQPLTWQRVGLYSCDDSPNQKWFQAGDRIRSVIGVSAGEPGSSKPAPLLSFGQEGTQYCLVVNRAGDTVEFEICSDMGAFYRNFALSREPQPVSILVPDGGLAAAVAQAKPLQVGWTRLPGIGAASEIGIGANGMVWLIGTDAKPGGSSIVRFDGKEYFPIPGGAVRVAVDPQGNAWVVNNKRDIFRYDGKQWIQVPGAAQDIAIGGNGAVWVIGTDQQPNGFGVHRWDGKQWVMLPGGNGVRVAVDQYGNPWVIGQNQRIQVYVGGRWQLLPGLARDIAVGARGHIWVVGTNAQSDGGYGVYYWDNKGNWLPVTGALNALAVAPDGKPWGIGAKGEIYRMQ